MIRESTEKSLLLIDEFGKGTDSTDGMSLLTSTVIHFQKRSRIPKIVVATHFSEVLFCS